MRGSTEGTFTAGVISLEGETPKSIVLKEAMKRGHQKAAKVLLWFYSLSKRYNKIRRFEGRPFVTNSRPTLLSSATYTGHKYETWTTGMEFSPGFGKPVGCVGRTKTLSLAGRIEINLPGHPRGTSRPSLSHEN